MGKPYFSLADLVRQGGARMKPANAASAPHLRPVTGFGSDPGHLAMLAFVPDGLPVGAPLVVALHGCTQTAAGYDQGCGWSTLAARHGFALLLPEQRQANNPNRCFNWFEPGDTTRGQGEAESIRQAIAHLVAQHSLDARRIFITGLSAGGAMTAAMLATCPEVFAAGAIIAGLPYGSAASMPQAFEAMAGGRPRGAAAWAGLVRAASPHRGPWPRVAVWQGEADTTVRPANAAELVKQWTALHGLADAPVTVPAEPGHTHRAWRDAAGVPLVEYHGIAGMAHGVPVDPASGVAAAAPFILDVGVSSTQRIAAFFGIAAAEAPRPVAPSELAGRVIAIGRDGAAQVAPPRRDTSGPWPGTGPDQVIRKALAAAGLLKR
ncbi:LpqC, poly [Siccirubricoccus deserti]|nr:LpqC, poly [Siccirubricoccus deserti]